MKIIGIECESIENKEWGIGRIITNLLKEIAKRPELKENFRFYLFFKSEIPKLPYLDNTIFKKKIIRFPGQWFSSFTLYYFIFLPIYSWFKKIDVIFFPNYMLPYFVKTKTIVHMTNDIYYEMNSPNQKLRHRIAYKLFSTWAIKHATKLLTWSYSAKKKISKLFKINF